jgi:hypothetical protein
MIDSDDDEGTQDAEADQRPTLSTSDDIETATDHPRPHRKFRRATSPGALLGAAFRLGVCSGESAMYGSISNFPFSSQRDPAWPLVIVHEDGDQRRDVVSLPPSERTFTTKVRYPSRHYHFTMLESTSVSQPPDVPHTGAHHGS